jgi:myo-inositol-1(or 4)-monophosphatase
LPGTERRGDLDLIVTALRQAGEIARAGFAGAPQVWEKSKGNPVTETDIAVDRHLAGVLGAARPDYGWLSEEMADNPARLSRQRLFIVDPIDGTLAFIKRKPEFVVCVAVVDGGVPVTSGIYNPMTEEMFTAAAGEGAFLNGQRIAVTARRELAGCRMLVARDVIEHKAWPEPWPQMDVGKRASIAYRMALVANGHYDCMMALSTKQEWDTAAATLLVQEAGGLVTSHAGESLVYNQPQPSHRSVVCAGPALHQAIMERTDRIKLP